MTTLSNSFLGVNSIQFCRFVGITPFNGAVPQMASIEEKAVRMALSERF